MPLDASAVPELVAYFVFGILGYLALTQVKHMSKTLERLEESVHDLNEKIATLLTTQEHHDEQIDDHELRIREIEKKIN